MANYSQLMVLSTTELQYPLVFINCVEMSFVTDLSNISIGTDIRV